VDHIIDVLEYRKVCARWVPRMLTAEMQASNVETCQQFLSRYEKEDGEFLHDIMASDETQVHHYELETKRQSMDYHKGSSAKKKSKTQGLRMETRGHKLFGAQTVLFTWTSINLGPPLTQSTTLQHSRLLKQ
jgi:histone-lysine N-methyltransferase SETMAR